MAKGRRLKVFQARLGFYDTVVAAPSQPAALRAWDVRQNLFAEGQAHVTDDPQAVEAALAHPGTPLRRAIGSDEPFALAPTSLPTVPDAPKRVARKPAAETRPEQQSTPPADRSALDVAEKALHALDEDRKLEEAKLRKRQDALDAERQAAQSAYVEAHKAAKVAIDDARRAYRKAGGED